MTPQPSQAQTLLEAVQRKLAGRWRAYPNSPQEAAYNSRADELFYGGAAGGGASAPGCTG